VKIHYLMYMFFLFPFLALPLVDAITSLPVLFFHHARRLARTACRPFTLPVTLDGANEPFHLGLGRAPLPMLGTYSDPLSTSAATESYSRLGVAALGMRNLGRALFVSVFRPPRVRIFGEGEGRELGVGCVTRFV
jgi:hypothetical protein